MFEFPQSETTSLSLLFARFTQHQSLTCFGELDYTALHSSLAGVFASITVDTTFRKTAGKGRPSGSTKILESPQWLIVR